MRSTAVRRAAQATQAACPPLVARPHDVDTNARVLSCRFSKLAVDKGMTKKQQDSCYSRIAAKLGKTALQLSMEAIDRTVVYLEGLGLSQRLALSAVAMHPMVDWLRANGVTGPLLLRAISRHPNILGVREEALSEVKEWYISQGVLPTKIPFMISVFPQVVSTSIHENLEPKRQFLMEQGLSQQQIVSVLQRSPQFMSLSLDRLEMKIKHLKKLGFSSDVITKAVANTPEALGLSIESIEAKLSVLTEILGTKEAAVDAWSSNPRVIMYNSEQLKRAYKFLISVVGVPHERMTKNIALLMRNVDRITRPRFEFLMKQQLMDRTDAAEKVFWIICSDHAFIERFPTYEGGGSGARREKSSEKRTKALE
ncbi:putative mitochondrial protein, partial [Globisporangium splendens]